MTTDFTCKGKCSQCGQCCMPCVPITLREYYAIKEYVSKNNIPPQMGVIIGNDFDLRCVFLDKKTNKCTIYPVRPKVCHDFLCSNSKRTIKRNRLVMDARADINGDHLDRLVPLDLLFYDIPITAIYMAYGLFNKTNPKDLVDWLYDKGSDREFFEAYQLPSTYDVAVAIDKTKEIKLEWSDEDEKY